MEGYSPKKKIYTAAEIGAPVDPEAIPEKELFRASLSFDFVFTEKDGELRPYCIEINGDNSGLAGVQKIDRDQIDSTQKIMAGIRDTRNKKLRNKVNEAKGITEDLNSGDFPASKKGKEVIAKYLKASIDKEPLLPKAYVNDEFIQEVADDKSLQEDLIPEANKPRHLYPGDDITSKTGYWIAKPRQGIAGKDIHIFQTMKSVMSSTN